MELFVPILKNATFGEIEGFQLKSPQFHQKSWPDGHYCENTQKGGPSAPKSPNFRWIFEILISELTPLKIFLLTTLLHNPSENTSIPQYPHFHNIFPNEKSNFQ